MLHTDKNFGSAECSVCSSVFLKTSGSSNTCSNSCRLKKRRLSRVCKSYKKVCDICQVSFESVRSHVKRCSEDCSKLANRLAEDNWHAINPDSGYLARSRYRLTPKGKIRNQRRKLILSERTIPFSEEDKKKRWAYFGDRCVYCGDSESILTDDHTKPLSKGGWHCLSNLRPACISCNSSKKDSWTGVESRMFVTKKIREGVR